MTSDELRAQLHARTEQVLTDIDACLATIRFGEFLILAIGESEAFEVRDMIAEAKHAQWDSEGCYYTEGNEQ